MRSARYGFILSAIAIAVATHMLAARATNLSSHPGVSMQVGPNDIGGVVSSSKGPEAGVWVIAETTDLPTRYIKEVVTDDRGRYLIPDLPKATYTVWARGYGLVDSPKVQAEPGQARRSQTGSRAGRKIRRAILSGELLVCAAGGSGHERISRHRATGNGISTGVRTQGEWIHLIKTDSCESCHQLGNQYTRTIPSMFSDLDPAQAWTRRVQSGQAGAIMTGGLAQLGTQRAAALFGDWTTRIAKGELPANAPPRPQGVERNVVITQWDWADPKAYLHDEISTDKRNPRVNANGLIYGSPEESRDYLPVLDPVHNSIGQVRTQYRDPDTPDQPKPLKPSAVWGDEAIWDSHTTVHNPMFDERGRLWFTARIRAGDDPAFCKAGSDLISAKLTPLTRSGRQLEMYDPATKKVEMIDTCFGTHHLQFARMPTTLCGRAAEVAAVWSAGSTPKCGTRRTTRRNRRAGPLSCSIPTATASATPTPKARRTWPPRRAVKVWELRLQ